MIFFISCFVFLLSLNKICFLLLLLLLLRVAVKQSYGGRGFIMHISRSHTQKKTAVKYESFNQKMYDDYLKKYVYEDTITL